MRRATVFCFLFVVIATAAVVLGSRLALAQEKGKIVHDAEYYILEAQHGEKWAAEDKELDANLAELRKKYGQPPNIIHIMWDDTPVGEVGIPQIQKMRGFETPKINQLAERRGNSRIVTCRILTRDLDSSRHSPGFHS